MKDLFDAERYRQTAEALHALDSRLDRKRFLRIGLEDLDDLELMDRLRRMSRAFQAAHSGTYREKLDLLRAYGPQLGSGFVGIWLCDFVAQFGLDDRAASLATLRDLTRYGSAEFAVRPFLVQDQARTLAVMLKWAHDDNEHVRRLASEGSRPRLPWGQRLTSLVTDPSPTAPILEALKADPALYVRKSVANHLNDIAKDHPTAVLERVETWDRADARTAWIVRHAIRTLIKRGDPRALALLGAGAKPAVDITRFSAAPKRIQLGDTITYAVALHSTSRQPQTLIVDYVVHYPKASGATSTKVFKWKTLMLAAGGNAELAKSQVIRDFSTRRHYAGAHRVELQINGQRLAETAFDLHA